MYSRQYNIVIMHVEQTLKLKVAISKTNNKIVSQYTFNTHDFIKKEEQNEDYISKRRLPNDFITKHD